MSKTITVLGSTGSIGTQSINVCRANNFKIEVLTANSNIELLEKQAREFNPKTVVVADKEKYATLKTALSDTSVEVLAGSDAVEHAAGLDNSNLVINAVTGFAGLRPTLATLNAGKQLALANKEAIVVGGELVMRAAKDNNIDIRPVDSEHSAIWQCLRAGKQSELNKIILTASGGPFYGRDRKSLEGITVEQALNHPTWSMGTKISIDSATLMNKGLEFIEAMHLFGLRPEQIEVVVHPQSIVHSAVEFIDGSVIAQMGNPDMRVAIQYAITYPDRLPLSVEPLSLPALGNLSFGSPDLDTFTCLDSCIKAAKIGGFAPCIVNGANEQAVELFLNKKIAFTDIGDYVSSALKEVTFKGEITLDSLEKADRLSREYVLNNI